MVKLRFCNEYYEAEKAYRWQDEKGWHVRLATVAEPNYAYFGSIKDMSDYVLLEGDWSEPEPQSTIETEQLRADVDYIAIMTGVDL